MIFSLLFTNILVGRLSKLYPSFEVFYSVRGRCVVKLISTLAVEIIVNRSQ